MTDDDRTREIGQRHAEKLGIPLNIFAALPGATIPGPEMLNEAPDRGGSQA
ncbi:hypothetical protein [Streptosporangium jomthongense]|uniref:Uncharacterized protein n=1 Tax=Streptosporangium jomthongense TaxID=1193683 RepID=A0ABV8F7Z2_9ACTN